MSSNELFTQMEGLWSTFAENHTQFSNKGTKSAAARARKAIGDLKKLVTEYRKLSVTETKGS